MKSNYNTDFNPNHKLNLNTNLIPKPKSKHTIALNLTLPSFKI